MRNLFRHKLALLMTAVLVVTGFAVQPGEAVSAAAQSIDLVQPTVDEDALASSLDEQGVRLEAVDVESDDVHVAVSSELNSGEEVDAEVVIAPEDATASLTIAAAGTRNDAEYTIDIRELNDDAIAFSITMRRRARRPSTATTRLTSRRCR